MIIDATDLVLGRMSAYVAKQALQGEKVDIINCEKAVITGNKKQILARYHQKRELGRNPYKGPFYPRASDRIVKRTIRGMLPYKQEKGKKAFKSVMCYVGVPSKLKDQKPETLPKANVSKLKNYKYITVGEISKLLGATR
ncbi:50S ribosomal protein L13 [Candidatus Woesearchaeota archaeon]|nr:50S ribosomal protein L13 [Candidatus Woesearchaeota archaeon]